MQKVIIWRYPHHTLTNKDCKPQSWNESFHLIAQLVIFAVLSVAFAVLPVNLTTLSVTLNALSTSSTKKIHTTNRQCGIFPYLFYRTDENAFAFIFGCFVCKICCYFHITKADVAKPSHILFDRKRALNMFLIEAFI